MGQAFPVLTFGTAFRTLVAALGKMTILTIIYEAAGVQNG